MTSAVFSASFAGVSSALTSAVFSVSFAGVSSASASAVSSASSTLTSLSAEMVSSTSSLASSIFLINSAVSFSAFSTTSLCSSTFGVESSIFADSFNSSMLSEGCTDLTTFTPPSVSSTTNLFASFEMNSFCFSVIGTCLAIGCSSLALALLIVAVWTGLIGSWNGLTSSSLTIWVLTLSGVLCTFLVVTASAGALLTFLTCLLGAFSIACALCLSNAVVPPTFSVSTRSSAKALLAFLASFFAVLYWLSIVFA